MIGAVAAVWAIGVAIYQFIYGYFDRRYLSKAKWMANHPEPADPQQGNMVCGLVRNYWVYWGYLVGGFLALLSLYWSGITLANESQETVQLAYYTFAAAIIWHFGLFTFEFATSMRQVGELAIRIDEPLHRP